MKSGAQLIIETQPGAAAVPFDPAVHAKNVAAMVPKPEPRPLPLAEHIVFLAARIEGNQKRRADLQESLIKYESREHAMLGLKAHAEERLRYLANEPELGTLERQQLSAKTQAALDEVRNHLKEATRWVGIRKKQLEEVQALLDSVTKEEVAELKSLRQRAANLDAARNGNLKIETSDMSSPVRRSYDSGVRGQAGTSGVMG
jgi:hypothetical protein